MVATLSPYDVERELGREIVELLHEHGKTQRDLARSMNMGYPALNRRINGRTAWTCADVVDVALFFGIMPSQLVCRAERRVRRSLTRSQSQCLDNQARYCQERTG